LKKKLKKIIHDIGNGLVVGAADHDPAGISTCSIVGASTGFSQLWLVLLATPLLITVQSICARIGDVTKKGLAQIIKATFGRKVGLASTSLLLIANLFTLGADFLGIGAALNLIFPQINTIYFLLPLMAFLWWLLIFKSYQAVYKTLLIFSVVFISYIIAGFLAKPDWAVVIQATLSPKIQFSTNYWMIAVAFLGTTISPYLFYWQVAEEIENRPTVRDAKSETKKVAFGMIFASTIAFFIILTSAVVLHANQIEVHTAADAALALKPLAGPASFLLFAVGLIVAGLLAIPVIAASAAYATAETFGWSKGLKKNPQKAQGFYTVLTAAFAIGLGFYLLKIPAIQALFYSQIFNGLATPVFLAIIMIVSNRKKVMGEYRNGLWSNIFGWFAVFCTAAAALAMLFSFGK